MAYQSRLELVVDSRSGERNLRSFERELGKAQGAGDSLASRLGGLTTIIASVAAVAGGFSLGRVVRETAGFEQSLLGLQVVSGATAAQMKELEAQSRSLGATSIFSAQQAADAQNYLAMAGFNVNEVLEATPGLLELAAAGSMDLASAADLASNVLGGFRLEVDKLGRVNDVLAAAAAGSNTNIMQLGQALSYAAPIASAAGVSIEETAAAVGVLSDAGLQGSRAGTGLLGVIRQLSNITPNATKALASYGLSAADVNIEQRGLVEVLGELSGANISAADSFKIFGSEAGPAAQILASGAVRVNEFTGELELAEGAARRAALILGSGLQGSMKSFSSAVGESTLQLGRDSGLSAGLQDVIDYATGVISVYNGMLPLFQEANDLTDEQAQNLNSTATALALTAGAVGGLTTAYIGLTGAVWAAHAAQTAFLRLLRVNPIALAAGAVISLGGALYTARNRTVELGDTTADISDWMLGTWQEVTTRVEDYWGETVDNVIAWLDDMGVDADSVASGIKDAFVTALDVVLGAHRTLFNTAVGIWYAQQTVVMGVADAITTAFNTVGTNARTVFNALWQDIQAMLTLDFSTSHFTNALENELISVAAAVGNSVAETAGRAAEQLTDDHLGRLVGNAKAYFNDLGTTIENRVATNQQIDSLTALSRRLLSLGGSAEETGETVVVLGDKLDITSDSVDKLTKTQREAQQEAKRFSDSLQTLTDRLYPVEAAQRTYAEEQALLTKAWNEGTITADRYTEAMQRLERAQLSTQAASTVYNQGFGSEIGSRGEAGSPTDPLAKNDDDDYWAKWLESASTALTDFDQLAANTAESFQRGFGNAFESMMFDSENAGDAARNMLLGMSRTAVNAIGQMIGQWVAYQAVQLATGKTAEAAAIGSAAVAGPAIAAAYAPAAAAVSLASFGANSAPAMVGMSSAYGLSSTLAMAGFAEGGWTGPGAKHDIAGIVHADEYVMPKDVVSRPGMLPFLESLRNSKGYANGGYVGSSPTLTDRLDIYRGGQGSSSTTSNSYQISVDARGATNPAETRRQARLGAEEAIRQTQRDFERNGPLRRTLNV